MKPTRPLTPATDAGAIVVVASKPTPEQFAEARNRVSRAVVDLIVNAYFFGAVLNQVETVADPFVPTMGTHLDAHGNPKIRYNPFFALGLSSEECRAVLEHEVLHIVKADLVIGPANGYEHDLWNISADLASNQFIRGLPEDALSLAMMRPLALEPLQTGQYYYAKLRQEHDSNPRFRAAFDAQMGHCGKSPSNSGGGNSDGDSQGGGAITCDASGWGLHGLPKEIAREVLGGIAQRAYEQASDLERRQGDAVRAWGPNPSGVKSLIEAALKPSVNWKRLVWKFIDGLTYSHMERTRNRPNRRVGFAAPATRIERKCHIAYAIDTSGSMSDPDLAQGAAELRKIAELFDVTVIQSDAAVHHVQKYDRRKGLREFFGRGGTDFRPAFEKAQRLQEPVQGLIYFTDACGTWPEQAPPFPVLIAHVGDYQNGIPAWAQKVKVSVNG